MIFPSNGERRKRSAASFRVCPPSTLAESFPGLGRERHAEILEGARSWRASERVRPNRVSLGQFEMSPDVIDHFFANASLV